MELFRQARSILALPFMVVVVIPSSMLAFFPNFDTRWVSSYPYFGMLFLVAVVLFLSGSFLFFTTVHLFVTVGKGTLAPWDPTRNLVVQGPYRYVRNPMITAVLTVLAAEALMVGSLLIAIFAILFFTLNHVYFILSEEPGLVRRFGELYEEYKRHVPRWMPRTTPWSEANGR